VCLDRKRSGRPKESRGGPINYSEADQGDLVPVAASESIYGICASGSNNVAFLFPG
jgi:hypothetical protein